MKTKNFGSQPAFSMNLVFLGLLAYWCGFYFLDGGKRRSVFFALTLLALPHILSCLRELPRRAPMLLPAFFLFSTYFAFSALWGNGDWLEVVKNTFFILVLMTAIEMNAHRLRQDFVADFWIVAGGVAALIYGVMLWLSPETAESRSFFGSFVRWASSNPIDCANVLGIPIIAAWHVFPAKSSRRIQFSLLFVMAACFALMHATSSRGPILSLCIVFAGLAAIRRRKEDIVLLAFLLVISVVMALHFDFAQRLMSKNYRLEIWKDVFAQIKENWLFGSGFGIKADIALDVHPVSVSHGHNSFLEILRQGGIIGSVLFLIMMFCVPLKTYFCAKRRFFLAWLLYGALCLSSNGRFLITHSGRIEILSFWAPLFLLFLTRTTQDLKPAINPWEEKARALDNYRFALSRQRHGVLGSLLRFVRDMTRDTLFGLCARVRLAKNTPVDPCDFLLLQASPKVIGLQRKKLLKQALRARGHTLTETALPKVRDILRLRQLKHPSHFVPLRYFLFAAHAEWLAARHAPKILLNDRNGSLYSPFLRISLKQNGGLLVHMAHATTTESSQRLSMNDYDCYFLFGKSSLEALQARAVLFGESRAVLSGSHMIDHAYDLPPAKEQKSVVLVLGVGPDKERETGYQRAYALLREWIAAHPEIRALVKAHPRSRVPFWQEAARALPNLSILPGDCTLAQALEQTGIAVNIMSNAVIEAALARRPVLFVNLSDDKDIFQQERFFGTIVQDLDALELRIHEIMQDYSVHVAASERFSHFHLSGGFQGLQRTVAALESLMNKDELPHDVENMILPEKLPPMVYRKKP
ncbi:MAG: O-antigen ligase family protein [Zoogloeaceae bacterium]|jgi:O-antigen ligase|nr:O-antigen ligase family protein [Zoogloeaceae bacterium]